MARHADPMDPLTFGACRLGGRRHLPSFYGSPNERRAIADCFFGQWDHILQLNGVGDAPVGRATEALCLPSSIGLQMLTAMMVGHHAGHDLPFGTYPDTRTVAGSPMTT